MLGLMKPLVKSIYQPGQHEKEITEWCEKNELNLNAKQSKTLVSEALWTKQLDIAKHCHRIDASHWYRRIQRL
jgi:hypothetical protein